MGISKENSVQELNEKLSQEGIDAEKLNNALNKNKTKTEKMLQDKEKTHKVLNSARDICAKISKKLANIPYVGGVFEDTAIGCDMIADYIDRKYKEVPLASIITMFAAIIYLVSPIDLIPDVIPILGQLDDAAVLLIAFRAIDNDLQDYANWKVNQLEASDSEENRAVEE